MSLKLPCLLLAVSLLIPSLSLAGEGAGKALISAAQKQDLAGVKTLLEQGVDINSATSYGSTALSYAAEKGNLPMVRLLLDEGANPNVTDTFYKVTPLLWALSSYEKSDSYGEIALLLLAKGAEQTDAALTFGVRLKNLPLVQAAVEKGEFSQDSLRASQKTASAAGQEDIATFLATLLTEDEAPAPALKLSQEDMQPYAGSYRSEQLGMTIKVWVEEDSLKVQGEGQPAFTLGPTGEDTFSAQEAPGIDLAFSGRGGLIEGFSLTQGGQTFQFPRLSEETTESANAEPEPAALPPIPPANRLAGAPWPSFRGPGASGIGAGQGMPTSWDGEAKENIRWRTPIPGIALSSPVIWGDRIFISTAASEDADSTFRTGLYGDVDSVEDDSTHSFRLYALDRDSGEILWQREASSAVPKVKRHLKSSHANPTPVTDGQRVVVHFPSEGLHCYDLDGKELWHKDLGILGSGWFYDASYEWGFASSPILHDGRVLIQADIYQGSFVAAFDLETGKELWRTAREEIPSWSSPNVLPAPGGKAELVTNGSTIRGYDVVSGEELWTLSPNSEVVVGTPVVADGLAYVTGGYPPARPIYALKPGGKGDLTLAEGETSGPSIEWSVARGGTYIPTPIVYRGILYMLHNNGRLAAHDAKTGEEIYKERVGSGSSFSSSPVAADGRLYMTSEEGTTFVLRAGRTYEALGENSLGEVVMSTPAISDGLLVIRAMHHVYGIGIAQQGKEQETKYQSRE
jgi:outer membrane protein assembly factor BamB